MVPWLAGNGMHSWGANTKHFELWIGVYYGTGAIAGLDLCQCAQWTL